MKNLAKSKLIFLTLLLITGLGLPGWDKIISADIAYAHIVAPTNRSFIKGVNTYIVGVATENVDFVEVSTNNGRTWQRAIPRRNGFQEWIYYWSWFESGEHTIVSRAISKSGVTQPNLEKYRINVKLPEKITLVQEIIVNDEKVMPVPEAEIDPFLADLAPHFDAIELKVWAHYWNDWTMSTVQKIIDRAHHYRMRVALSSWQYPNDNDISPWIYHAQQLDPETGQPYDILKKDRNLYPALDRANPEAVTFMVNKWKEKLSRLRDVDYVLFNEDMLQRWSTPWPEMATPYWESPTFSEAALENFRFFLVRKIGPTGWSRRFPVKETKFLNERTELNFDENYWRLWNEWRDEVFAEWINKMALWVHLAFESNPQFQGCIYMQWQRVIDSPKYGVNLDKIGHYTHHNWLAMFVNEHGEDADQNYNQERANYVAQKAWFYGKNFGGFVNFYAWAQKRYTPEVIVDEFNIAMRNHANFIVTFNAQTFYRKHRLYNQVIVNMWDQLRRRF